MFIDRVKQQCPFLRLSECFMLRASRCRLATSFASLRENHVRRAMPPAFHQLLPLSEPVSGPLLYAFRWLPSSLAFVCSVKYAFDWSSGMGTRDRNMLM